MDWHINEWEEMMCSPLKGHLVIFRAAIVISVESRKWQLKHKTRFMKIYSEQNRKIKA